MAVPGTVITAVEVCEFRPATGFNNPEAKMVPLAKSWTIPWGLPPNWAWLAWTVTVNFAVSVLLTLEGVTARVVLVVTAVSAAKVSGLGFVKDDEFQLESPA